MVVALTGAPSGEQLILPRRPGGRTGPRGADRRAHPGGRRAGVGLARAPTHSARCSPTWAASTTRWWATTWRRRWCSSPVANATQIVLGATQRTRWNELWRGSVVNRVVRASGDLDVHVISRVADEPRRRTLAWRPAILRSPLSRRRAAGWLLALLGIPLLTELW